MSKVSARAHEPGRLAQSCYGHLAVFSLSMVVLLGFERQILPFPTNIYVSLPLECLVV